MVHTKTVASKKMDNKGKLMMFVGNSPQHSGNVCRLFDADTGRVVISRDVNFIDKLYYRSDHTPTALVPHTNDIVLNHLHLPPTPQLEKAGKKAIERVEREVKDDDNSGSNDSETDATVGVKENVNKDRNGSEISRIVAEAVSESNMNQPMGLTESATQ